MSRDGGSVPSQEPHSPSLFAAQKSSPLCEGAKIAPAAQEGSHPTSLALGHLPPGEGVYGQKREPSGEGSLML